MTSGTVGFRKSRFFLYLGFGGDENIHILFVKYDNEKITRAVVGVWRGWDMTLDGGLAEEIDRIGVGSGGVGAHTGVGFEAFAATHEQHLMSSHNAASSFDRFLQFGDAGRIVRFVEEFLSAKIMLIQKEKS